jgi:geranylgeranyl diphosphate synthase type II
MNTFYQLSETFSTHFNTDHFPSEPASLYNSAKYFLQLGGKRIRPVLCLMGNELFDEINPDAWHVATAIELFHNFTLIHDDIMDKAPLRRGMQTVHEKFGSDTALLSGDVMLVSAYEQLNKISTKYLHRINSIFNKTAREVCEGQQLDMDLSTNLEIGENNIPAFDQYLNMINLKTSVLLAASLKMGAVLGGAGDRNQDLLYEFGRKLGLAFQVQDDYLDAYGDPEKFGKKTGGDINTNKKTFLLIHAFSVANDDQKKRLIELLSSDSAGKVEDVLKIFRECKVDEWARELKQRYTDEAFKHLEDVAVLSKRKEPLKQIAQYLTQREN